MLENSVLRHIRQCDGIINGRPASSAISVCRYALSLWHSASEHFGQSVEIWDETV